MPINWYIANAGNTWATVDFPKPVAKPIPRQFIEIAPGDKALDNWFRGSKVNYNNLSRYWTPGINSGDEFSNAISRIVLISIDLADSMLGKIIKEMK